MENVRTAIGRLVIDDDGQDLLEYGLLAVLIAVGAIAAVGTLGQTIYVTFWALIQHVL